mmetsp:Transcript_126275/g.351840  ORF Transcript_126275/g.351840 Transcript_126275/m.351840 type:complete len:239 (+) Transcript_126275:33-749(+)
MTLLPRGHAMYTLQGRRGLLSLDLHVLWYALVHECGAVAWFFLLFGPGEVRWQDLHQHGASPTTSAALLVGLTPCTFKLLLELRCDLMELGPPPHPHLHESAVMQASFNPVHVQDRLADTPRHKGATVRPERLLVLPAFLIETFVLPKPPLYIGVLHQQTAIKGPVDEEAAPDQVPAPYDRCVGQPWMQHAMELGTVKLRGDIPVGDDPEELQLHPDAALRLAVKVQVRLGHLVFEDG